MGFLLNIEPNIHSCYYTFNGTGRSEITKIGGGQAHEIQESGTNLSKSTVHRYLTAMNEEGMIQYDRESIITDAIEKINPAFINTGICGVIPCGTPRE